MCADSLLSPEASSALVLEAAIKGVTLPPGEFWFRPPLQLTDIRGLAGTAGRTTLRALPGHTGPLVTVTATLPGDVEMGLPALRTIRDLTIVGNGPTASEYGLLVEAGCLRVEAVEIRNCYCGVVGKWMVDVAFRDCRFSRNDCNVYIPGSGPNTVTSTTFSACQIREAGSTGVLIQNGCGVAFVGGDGWTIFESNRGTALEVQALAGVRTKKILVGPRVWFENNGEDIVDSAGVVRLIADQCWQGDGD